REVGDRPPEALRVLDERHQHPEGERALQDLPAPVEQDEGGGERGQELDRRVEDRVVEDRGHVRVGVLAVDPGEGLRVALFTASTSVVTRVMSRPTGFLSKKATCRPCRWPKISRRMSSMIRWPVICMITVWPKRTTRAARRVRR